MRLDDERFLREYSLFSCRISQTVVTALQARLHSAFAEKDYDTVAHIIAKLHSEMFFLYESAGALLRAFSLWDQPGGVVSAMLNYKPGDVRKFIQGLCSVDDVITAIRFPTNEDLRGVIGDRWDDSCMAGYSSETLRNKIGNFWKDYLTPSLRSSYNKLKHGPMVFRSPAYLFSGGEVSQSSDSIYILLEYAECGRPKYLSLSITGEHGRSTARKYFNNIDVATDLLAFLSMAGANFLKDGLMQKYSDPSHAG